MIPTETDFLEEDFEIEEEPDKTYRMDIRQQRIRGKTDGLEAVKQAVFRILNTERYQYLIYSWDYGIELLDLSGEPVSYVCPELERRIIEALEQDDRIEKVDEFDFEVTGNVVKAVFTVHTIFGNLKTEREVDI